MSTTTKLTNNFKTIKQLSEGCFNNEQSYSELEALRTFEANVFDKDIEFNAIDFNTRINEQSKVCFDADLGGLILKLNDKALGDVFQKSAEPIQIGDFKRLGHLTDLKNMEISVGRILLENAKTNTRSQEGHTAIITNDMIHAFVGRGYPTIHKTGLSTAEMINATLDVLPAMEDIRALPEGVQSGSQPLFECKFNQETGGTHGKIVYDFADPLSRGDTFAFGVEFKDNLFGSGKQVVTAFNLNTECMNGWGGMERIAGIIANHTSVSNMVKAYLNILAPVWGFGGAKTDLTILNAATVEVNAIMTRLQLVAEKPKAALTGKQKTVIDAKYLPVFYRMIGMSIIKYGDFRRDMEMDVIRAAATESVENALKELVKLEEKKLISRRDTETILHVLEEDDSIPEELRATQYGLSSAITRYANNFQASNDERYNELQAVGRNVLEVVPTVNYGRRNRSGHGTY